MPIDLEDVATLLGRDLTDAEVPRADRLASFAAAKLTDTLPGFTVEAGTETVELNPETTGNVWTPKYPVTAINSLEVDGNTITAGQYLFDQWGRIRASTTPIDTWQLNGFWTPVSTVAIDYDFGFDPITDDVSLAIASMVAAAIQRQGTNPSQIQAETLGAYSVTYGNWSLQQAAEGLTVPPGTLRHWKRNRALSVPLVTA